MSGIRKEIRWFILAGICAVGTDMLFYYILFGRIGHSPAKAASFLAGTFVAYVMNKYWTFEQHRRSYAEMARFGALYMTTLAANVGVNRASLALFPEAVLFSFLCATGTSTVLNFIGQKWWVFRRA